MTDFEDLSAFKDYRARSITSITGPLAFGSRLSRTNPNMDRLENIHAGEAVTLAEMKGPGEISHIWITVGCGEPYWPRKVMLRMYWDGEQKPSVESPIGDFFGLGQGTLYEYASAPFVIGKRRGLNCYWPMPYREGARIEIANEGESSIESFYYIVDYRDYDKPFQDHGLFHAKYRQEMPTSLGKNYLVFEASGRGHFVGLNMSVELAKDGWWGAGDAMIWVDGEKDFSVAGTAGEDYFGGAWGYAGGSFSSLYLGNPLQPEQAVNRLGARWNVYRYLIPDPVPFKKEIRMEFEVIEDIPAKEELVYRQDHYSSVAYWYQAEPHREFFDIPRAPARLPKEIECPETW